MSTPIIPETFAEWRHCIEVECGIALDSGFIRERVAALENAGGDEARRFAALYGDAHRERVAGWFRQAGAGVAAE